MVADSTNDQELALKKRARRRLVGAISLVILMVIVLPIILQDRSTLAPQNAIKITMSEENVKQPINAAVSNNQDVNKSPVDVIANDSTIVTDTPLDQAKEEVNTVKEPIVKNDVKANSQSEKIETKLSENSVKVSKDVNSSELKPPQTNPTEEKLKTSNSGTYTIQVGVFSNMDNVKELQDKLKQAGLAGRVENITTPKGEKIRLRAGSFSSRQDAAYALTKLQENGLTGMVISNN